MANDTGAACSRCSTVVVVAAYKHPLRWLRALLPDVDELRIVNKGRRDRERALLGDIAPRGTPGAWPRLSIEHVPNVGREGSTFLDQLALAAVRADRARRVLFMLQDNPLGHVGQTSNETRFVHTMLTALREAKRCRLQSSPWLTPSSSGAEEPLLFLNSFYVNSTRICQHTTHRRCALNESARQAIIARMAEGEGRHVNLLGRREPDAAPIQQLEQGSAARTRYDFLLTYTVPFYLHVGRGAFMRRLVCGHNQHGHGGIARHQCLRLPVVWSPGAQFAVASCSLALPDYYRALSTRLKTSPDFGYVLEQ
jgi:hypothetical protein